MMIVRENTEGEYSSVGGRMYQNTDREIAIQEKTEDRKTQKVVISGVPLQPKKRPPNAARRKPKSGKKRSVKYISKNFCSNKNKFCCLEVDLNH